MLECPELASFPRTCGGDPLTLEYHEVFKRFSPHLRG